MTISPQALRRSIRTLLRWVVALVVVSSSAVGLLPAISTAATTAAIVSPTRIMPLGDSLTSGATVQGGYRNELEDLLIGGKYDFNFVGTMVNGLSSLEAMRHEGHPGYRIDEIAASADAWIGAWPSEIVLLMIGTNDIRQDYQLDSAPQRLSSLLDQIVTRLPGAHVLVASIPPLADPVMNAKAEKYNAAIPGIVSDKVAQGKNVGFVDVNAVLTTADLSDGVHLTAAGYAKAARAWYDALLPFLPTRSSSPRACPCSIWAQSDTPAILNVGSTVPVELGLKFRSDVDGSITGIRFYKGPSDVGAHVAHLWTRTGTLLAEAAYTNETASGWQEVSLTQPVSITADTTYVASYYAPVGQHAQSDAYFNNKMAVNWPLRGLAWGMSGWNGTFKWNGTGFPGDLPNGQPNYWVDVVFEPKAAAPPSAPTGLSAAAASSSRIDLSWNDVATETSYAVQRSADGTTGWTQVGTTSQDVTTFADGGLTSATTYFYRVVASNAGGDSPPSSVASATTLGDTTPPSTPTGLTVAGAKRKANLSWNASTDTGGSGLAGYEVWRSTDPNGAFARIATTGSGTTSYRDTAVSSNVSYWYYVVAFDGAGNRSERSNVASVKVK